MTAKWGNKRLEERLEEIDSNLRAREEEARRPKTIEELVSLKVEDIETGERMAAALEKGITKQIAFAQRKRAVTTQDSGGWMESRIVGSPADDIAFTVEVAYELAPDAHRVHIQSRQVGSYTVLEAHFLVPFEAIALRTRTKYEYEAWLNDIAVHAVKGHFRPPHARARNIMADLALQDPDEFTPLGLIDQTGGTLPSEPAVDQEAAIASIRRAFEEDDLDD